MESGLDKRFPLNAKEYKLFEEVGDGVSATVYRALCIPLKETVAIKVLDLEKCNSDLDGIRREVQMMNLIDHPNLLRAHCSFSTGHHLWVVMPYMAGGSCLHIMKSDYPDGFEEFVIATLLRETLKALVYLHAHGHIHRDVKAGNILIDSNGTVKLADFGVSAWMFDTGDRQRSRNTFVGTPCWMAPEVMQQLHGYDFKADIWSFGITALELAHGHAPFSKYPPMKVLLMTLQNAPPGLDYERDKRFTKSFKELVGACLVKDPKKRPPAEKLLRHHFFKQARPPDYLARAILNGLPPLGERYRKLKSKEADLLVQNKSEYEEQLSQQEYIRGISAWNFNLEDLKNQAALIPDDDDDVSHTEEPDVNRKSSERHDEPGLSPERTSSSATAPSQEDELNDLQDLESSLASFPIKPLQALKGCFDIGEDDDNATTLDWKDASKVKSGPQLLRKPSIGSQAHTARDEETATQNISLPRQVILEQKKYLSGSLISESTSAPKRNTNDAERDFQQSKHPAERSYSGPLYPRMRRETSLPSVDDTSEGAVVQRKGRFKVTSADLSPKGPTNCTFGPFSGVGSTSPNSLNVTAASVLPSLQYILQQNAIQREEIMRLIKYVEQTSGKQSEPTETSIDELLQTPPATARERELQSQLMQLQQSIWSLAEEVKKQKQINGQLESQLKTDWQHRHEGR
ncbi:PREDICTED: serine/threonine-protein kinase BLUS1-like [Tarenaya hassleriana]|uniref:serine/threonine-protein kinase BLUS1-like n=1 Tax=Tarenaya hassleriana TaxID=28532 RepID=UPI00053CA06B|nr:PREDICTED: serine/threonine-protein kinase BLUS1-like [Tarenaya hassleriana]XP_010551904.1 PREDICTED: serine/threonine-protein kinase BLUS1-like [Tarenaya hassleriana]